MKTTVSMSGQGVKMLTGKAKELLRPIINNAIDSASLLGLSHSDTTAIAQVIIKEKCPSVMRVLSHWALTEGILPPDMKMELTVTLGEHIPAPDIKFTVGINVEGEDLDSLR